MPEKYSKEEVYKLKTGLYAAVILLAAGIYMYWGSSKVEKPDDGRYYEKHHRSDTEWQRFIGAVILRSSVV